MFFETMYVVIWLQTLSEFVKVLSLSSICNLFCQFILFVAEASITNDIFWLRNGMPNSYRTDSTTRFS